MERKLSMDEIEKRFAEIDVGETEEPTVEDLAAFEAADTEDPADAVTLEEYKTKHSYEFASVSAEQMTEDSKQILEEFASDYERMAKCS